MATKHCVRDNCGAKKRRGWTCGGLPRVRDDSARVLWTHDESADVAWLHTGREKYHSYPSYAIMINMFNQCVPTLGLGTLRTVDKDQWPSVTVA